MKKVVRRALSVSRAGLFPVAVSLGCSVTFYWAHAVFRSLLAVRRSLDRAEVEHTLDDALRLLSWHPAFLLFAVLAAVLGLRAGALVSGTIALIVAVLWVVVRLTVF